jgi:hypothetical protein
MKTIKKGIFSGIKKDILDVYIYYKLVKTLKNWQRKYSPDQYDKVISDVFKLINKYNLQPGKLSPQFTLQDIQLGEEFIKKFFEAAEDNGYQIKSKSCAGYTTFNLIG